MGRAMEFDYYYGIEAEQFSFYRVPRLLIKDERFKGLSSDAKLLYGLMLDRMSLSMKNGWLDEGNRAYVIYTIDAIREDLGCSKEKAVKVLAELDSNKGIGLVEKVRRGLGKPDILYVKNFAISEGGGKEASHVEPSTEVGKTDFRKSEKPTLRSQKSGLQEVGKADFKKSEKPISRGQENRLQEVGETDSNYTDMNYTDPRKTNPIYQSGNRISEAENQTLTDTEMQKTKTDMMDTMGEVNTYMALIRKNLEYEHYMAYASHGDRELFEEIYETICDVVCVKRSTIRINGEEYPYELVKSRFLKLNGGHVEYVMGCMKDTAAKITNIRAYLVTALYNAPTTMNHYYQQEVQHDMYGGGWEEKGVR